MILSENEVKRHERSEVFESAPVKKCLHSGRNSIFYVGGVINRRSTSIVVNKQVNAAYQEG